MKENVCHWEGERRQEIKRKYIKRRLSKINKINHVVTIEFIYFDFLNKGMMITLEVLVTDTRMFSIENEVFIKLRD